MNEIQELKGNIRESHRNLTTITTDLTQLTQKFRSHTQREYIDKKKLSKYLAEVTKLRARIESICQDILRYQEKIERLHGRMFKKGKGLAKYSYKIAQINEKIDSLQHK